MKRLIIYLLCFLPLFFSPKAFSETFQGLSYTVLNETSLDSTKRSLDVRLEKKADAELLTNLAHHLKKNSTDFARTFICYYLPGQVPGSGAWATAHFDPELVVKILGPSLADEKKLKSKTQKISDLVIGEWFDNSPYVGGIISFVKRSNKIFMIRKFKDGSGGESEMLKTKKSAKDCFTDKADSSRGEYYLIESNGDLGVYDSEGLLKVITRLEK